MQPRPQQHITRNLTDGHRNMERVLTLVRLQLDAIRDGAEAGADFRLLGSAIVYMRDYPGVNHHPVEELIFAKLVGYAPEHGLACAELAGQHRSFGEREKGLLHHIRKARLGDEMARRHVKDLGTAYCADHSSHIRSEEADVFPGAVRWLTPMDWQEVARRSRETIDPELQHSELKRYDNLYDRLMALDADVSGNPAPLRRGEASRG
ncbi:MAG TPA: hemerythrin domain-containing protein [Gammaproteobacteria bacterium]|nr:hemerythrin domain-containing protein [Gammaproteobacteria bacterium]